MGPGRDPRPLAVARGGNSGRFIDSPTAVMLVKRVRQPLRALDGPPVLEEYAIGQARVGFNFETHNLDWEAKSGTAPKGGAALEHNFVSALLYLMLTGGEVVTRDFDKWIADRQKDEGYLLRRQQLWREERTADDKRQNGDETGDRSGQGAAAAGKK